MFPGILHPASLQFFQLLAFEIHKNEKSKFIQNQCSKPFVIYFQKLKSKFRSPSTKKAIVERFLKNKIYPPNSPMFGSSLFHKAQANINLLANSIDILSNLNIIFGSLLICVGFFLLKQLPDFYAHRKINP